MVWEVEMRKGGARLMTLICSKGFPFWLVDVVDEGCKND